MVELFAPYRFLNENPVSVGIDLTVYYTLGYIVTNYEQLQ